MTTLDYRNINTLWASIIAETFSRLGLTTAITCPGSRSTPLTVALARHPNIEAIPILDERSAAFFALGRAKRERRPTAVICTSGTAGANFYPAVIESATGKNPLIVLTADRPPELRDCSSGQTIDQQKLFGSFPNWYSELALPSTSLLNYVRQTIVHAWQRAQLPQAGPVHLNCPFRDPLAPLSDSPLLQLKESAFFSALTADTVAAIELAGAAFPDSRFNTIEKGIIIAGPATPKDPVRYCQSIAQLSQALGWPVLADALSPLRNYQSLNPLLVSGYDILLRDRSAADMLAPEVVLQIEALPTSKVLREWLATHQTNRYILSSAYENLDPLHSPSERIYGSIKSLADRVSIDRKPTIHRSLVSTYCQSWLNQESNIQKQIELFLSTADERFEGKISWLLSKYLPAESQLFVSNSMPVRDMESFWQANDMKVSPYFNRGANGIDGILSTAMGIACSKQPTFLLTGDLAFLHDVNGLLNQAYLKGRLTVIVVNNNGGGIFEMLPIAKFDPPFETYFATPQTVKVADLCQVYGVKYRPVENCASLITLLEHSSDEPGHGLEVWEIETNRKADAAYRKTAADIVKALD